MPEDAPLELTNKILRGMRSFPALVGAGALSWLAPPTLVGTAFFLTGGTDLSREVLNSLEDVVLASLSLVLGTLVLFDSAASVHEVLPTLEGRRVAVAGWFHEACREAPDWY